MGGDQGRKLLLRGRGLVQFEDFCRATGLDHATVENLMRSDLLDISLWRDKEHTRPFGIFDDVLTSRHSLAAMGLPERDDYDPKALRSHDERTDDTAGET
jgi:hypothetical protein